MLRCPAALESPFVAASKLPGSAIPFPALSKAVLDSAYPLGMQSIRSGRLLEADFG
jgi:hypothetical protein